MNRVRFFLSSLVVLIAVAALTLSGTAPEAKSSPAAAGTYTVDLIHSTMMFEIRYSGISTFYGRFNEYGGTFRRDESDLSKTSFDLVVKSASVDTGIKKRNGSLMSPDYFSSKQYPESRFVSKSTKVLGGKKLEVKGELTARGVTKPVTCQVVYGGEVPAGKDQVRAGFDGTITFKRSDFGINGGQSFLSDEVTLRFGLCGVKKK